MGYYVDVRGDVVIKKDKVKEAIKRLGELMDGAGDLGRGCAYAEGAVQERFFSWVGTNQVKEHLSKSDLVGALREWRYEFAETSDGDVCFEYFEGSKWGDDEHLWIALAPVIEAESVIEFHGEDDCRWRYVFNGDDFSEENGTVVWG